ncbi:hypothetical protein HD806DRAFT_543328 [Xylariaceae sp. AK1471]|nr:hypothetical protein HD806DRAFT_543328 [Xylariaceae sp. AK1471]
MAPSLKRVLPREGFRWKTGSGKFFLESKHCRVIVRALRLNYPVAWLDPEFVDFSFAQLFAEANEHIDDCANLEPESFWDAVGHEVRWIRNDHNTKSINHLDGNVLYALSLLILSARFFKKNDADDNYDNGVISYDHMRELMGNTELTRAVDEFKSKIYQTYPAQSETREKYIPRYTQESHNEGSADATNEAWKQLCRGEYKHSRSAYIHPADHDESDEEEDGDIVEEAKQNKDNEDSGGPMGEHLVNLPVRTKPQS